MRTMLAEFGLLWDSYASYEDNVYVMLVVRGVKENLHKKNRHPAPWRDTGF